MVNDCSLRAAVLAANLNAGADTIQFSSGVTYTLTIAPTGANDATSGDLNIKDAVTFIVGGGCGSACSATIQGGAGWSDRIFYIANMAQVALSDLSIRNGNVSGNGRRLLHRQRRAHAYQRERAEQHGEQLWWWDLQYQAGMAAVFLMTRC